MISASGYRGIPASWILSFLSLKSGTLIFRIGFGGIFILRKPQNPKQIMKSPTLPIFLTSRGCCMPGILMSALTEFLWALCLQIPCKTHFELIRLLGDPSLTVAWPALKEPWPFSLFLRSSIEWSLVALCCGFQSPRLVLLSERRGF